MPLFDGCMDWWSCYLYKTTAADGSTVYHDWNVLNPDAEHEGQLVADPQIGLALIQVCCCALWMACHPPDIMWTPLPTMRWSASARRGRVSCAGSPIRIFVFSDFLSESCRVTISPASPPLSIAPLQRVALAHIDMSVATGRAVPAGSVGIALHLAPFNTATIPAPPGPNASFTVVQNWRCTGDFHMESNPTVGTGAAGLLFCL